MEIGDKFIVIKGKHKGKILTSRLGYFNSKNIYPIEDLNNGKELFFKFGEYRKWTDKDEKINQKFSNLFDDIHNNINMNDKIRQQSIMQQYMIKTLNVHNSNLKYINNKYNLFLYEKKFSKEIIKIINILWKDELVCQEHYRLYLEDNTSISIPQSIISIPQSIFENNRKYVEECEEKEKIKFFIGVDIANGEDYSAHFSMNGITT